MSIVPPTFSATHMKSFSWSCLNPLLHGVGTSRHGRRSTHWPAEQFDVVREREIRLERCRRAAIRIDRLAAQRKKIEEGLESEEDLEICPADCVREIKTQAELDFVVQWGATKGILIVVDFFRTACGSCSYIATGFAKLCRLEGDQQLPVMFFKHNIMDDYEEPSDISSNLKIKAVPLFHLYKDGELVESFNTREKNRILEAINRHIEPDIHDFIVDPDS